MIRGKRPRTDETHIATDYVPELRQLVKAAVTHEISDNRQHPGVVRELEKALPFRARLRITAQMLLQPLLGVSIHRAKLQSPQSRRVAPDALLNVDRGARIDELNGKRKNDDDRRYQQRNGDREKNIDGALKHLIVSQTEVAPDLNSDCPAEHPRTQPRDLEIVHILDQQEAARRQPCLRGGCERGEFIRGIENREFDMRTDTAQIRYRSDQRQRKRRVTQISVTRSLDESDRP